MFIGLSVFPSLLPGCSDVPIFLWVPPTPFWVPQAPFCTLTPCLWVIRLSVPVADKSSAKRPDLVFAVFCLRSSEEYAIMKVSKAENVQGYAESGGYYIDLEVVSQDV